MTKQELKNWLDANPVTAAEWVYPKNAVGHPVFQNGSRGICLETAEGKKLLVPTNLWRQVRAQVRVTARKEPSMYAWVGA